MELGDIPNPFRALSTEEARSPLSSTVTDTFPQKTSSASVKSRRRSDTGDCSNNIGQDEIDGDRGLALSTEKLLSLDPSFHSFNMKDYEQEVARHKRSRNLDFKGIASGQYLNSEGRGAVGTTGEIFKRDSNNSNSSRASYRTCPSGSGTGSGHIGKKLSLSQKQNRPHITPVESSSLNILKAAPPANRNFDADGNSATELNFAVNSNSSNHDHVHNHDHDDVREYASAQTTVAVAETVEMDGAGDTGDTYEIEETESSPGPPGYEYEQLEEFNDYFSISLDSMHKKLSEHTKTFKKEIVLLERSSVFGDLEKLHELNKLYKRWAKDLRAQNRIFISYFAEFQDSVRDDFLEFADEISTLKSKVAEYQAEIQHLKSKSDALKIENKKNIDDIYKLNENILDRKIRDVDRDARCKQLTEDLQSFSVLMKRLINDGIWNLDGLKFSSETQAEVFKGHLNGNKLAITERDMIAHRFSMKDMKNERDMMQKELENFRSKIFSRERRLQKLGIEEQSIKSRIEYFKEEEFALKNRVADLKAEEKALRELGEM